MSSIRGLAVWTATCSLLWAGTAGAHGEHPHPPGQEHEEAAAEPAAGEATAADEELPSTPPEVTSESLPDDDEETAAAPPPAAPGYPEPDDGNVGAYRSRHIPDTTWRKRARQGESSGSRYTDFAHFFFELRFGPYSPQVDDQFDGAATPYADYFGTDPLFYFGLELDWLPLYLPYVVSLGPGFGWGVASTSAKTKLESDPTKEAESETGLTIFPMHLSAIARFDGPLRELNIPLVPYIKAGFGFASWSVSGPDGTAQSADGKSGEGVSNGLHLAIGGSVALNAFDPSTAMTMREDVGIRYAYLWGEWMWDNVGSFGSGQQMRVGTSTAVFGVALDF